MPVPASKSERWFNRWRALLGVLGVLLLLSVVGDLVDGEQFSWVRFALAGASSSSAYVGFNRRPYLTIGLAAIWTLLALPLLAWVVLLAFLNYVASTGNWNFGGVH